jgi:hypothetical protein
MFAIIKGSRDKIQINTSAPDKPPFYTTKEQVRRIRVFGILVWENTNKNIFPEPLKK